MSCCTPNAWGDLKNADYKEKGQVEKVDDLDIYRVGSSSNGKCIVWCYDVFGFKVSVSVHPNPSLVPPKIHAICSYKKRS